MSWVGARAPPREHGEHQAGRADPHEHQPDGGQPDPGAQQAGQPSLTLPQVQGPAVLAGYTESAAPLRQNVQQPASGWYEQRLPNYLRQHAQQAAASGTDSVLPYARAASLENR